jgi:hypothetical protein
MRKEGVFERISRRLEVGDCWVWTGYTSKKGYGQVGVDRDVRPVHRVVYEHLVGEIPAGLELDHLCRNRACCNPDHLEPVTHAENARRGAGGVSQQRWVEGHWSCRRGHVDKYSIDCRGNPVCLTCRSLRHRVRKDAS